MERPKTNKSISSRLRIFYILQLEFIEMVSSFSHLHCGYFRFRLWLTQTASLQFLNHIEKEKFISKYFIVIQLEDEKSNFCYEDENIFHKNDLKK